MVMKNKIYFKFAKPHYSLFDVVKEHENINHVPEDFKSAVKQFISKHNESKIDSLQESIEIKREVVEYLSFGDALDFNMLAFPDELSKKVLTDSNIDYALLVGSKTFRNDNLVEIDCWCLEYNSIFVYQENRASKFLDASK